MNCTCGHPQYDHGGPFSRRCLGACRLENCRCKEFTEERHVSWSEADIKGADRLFNLTRYDP